MPVIANLAVLRARQAPPLARTGVDLARLLLVKVVGEEIEKATVHCLINAEVG